MSIRKKYEYPLDELMENVAQEINSLDPENSLEEYARNEWQELYDRLDKAHSQIVFKLSKLYNEA
jgi:hypothetical protein